MAALVLLTACGGPASSPPARTPTSTPTPMPTPMPTATPTANPTPTPRPTPREGIDASHHQGPIDWRRVARAGITFAYLKATEGTGFTDPRFVAHRAAATRAGIDVAGYHYFQLCSDGAAQAAHFLDVVGRRPGPLAPALDLELVGSCTTPPPRAALLAEVRAFLRTVDAALRTRTVVYLYPDFEERYGLAADLADHPQWVRRLGERPPARPWHVWQYDDRGTVPGIRGGVDRNREQSAPANVE
ncbi:Lyzozyme M1 (1,4-beta-N-acetylmuramidase) [Pimelobacter simplex]|uniref:Lyzozyme M1 (1,4-beta-N-acetylmuramidase) n=1 Tax=Nocardioides simplex TaxID=2045 RepID=A0A0C5XC16_NOCSI|nr:Lyzozyme M1 (1,4-beta-N-acetylmuramidase) [Pimelobacter simplex]GEB15998.1 lysozyme [Pimelobacter simplex]SFM82432.1 lysozyme [Pimelobacter simplex]